MHSNEKYTIAANSFVYLQYMLLILYLLHGLLYHKITIIFYQHAVC